MCIKEVIFFNFFNLFFDDFVKEFIECTVNTWILVIVIENAKLSDAIE